jgi:hypothetical protein
MAKGPRDLRVVCFMNMHVELLGPNTAVFNLDLLVLGEMKQLDETSVAWQAQGEILADVKHLGNLKALGGKNPGKRCLY